MGCGEGQVFAGSDAERFDYMPPAILTIGHSTRAIEAFLELLRAHGVKRLVDVRMIPRSRYNPQFNCDTLAAALGDCGIGYTSMKEMGGLRHARSDSPDTAWRNLSFRGYADHMQTPEFAAGLAALIEIAGREQTAIMCAEAVPWRCHRSVDCRRSAGARLRGGTHHERKRGTASLAEFRLPGSGANELFTLPLIYFGRRRKLRINRLEPVNPSAARTLLLRSSPRFPQRSRRLRD